jgi:hypothetical protein
MELNMGEKIPKKFNCELCDYNTSSKKDLNKHLLTAKHLKRDKGNILEINGKMSLPAFDCVCSKQFITQSGLWKHKQKCPYYNGINSDIKTTDSDVKILTNMVLEVVKQNKELITQNTESQKQNQELTNKLYEICKNGTNNTMINNNSHNKTFNLQFFLNETCKDAMNIMDFVDSIKLQLTDLEKVGEVGYVQGISNIIVNNLKELDVTLRPIHCTDKKREILYIKDENKWEKDDDNKKKLRKVIKRVAHKNAKLLQLYKEKHPDCNKSSYAYSEQYNKIIIEAMGGLGNNDIEKENKIIRNITNVTTIDKNFSK